MAEKIVLDTPEPAATEWRIRKLVIAVDEGYVAISIRADNGEERRYVFGEATSPTGVQVMNAINQHDGSAERLNAWMLRQLQERDPALAGTVETT